MTSNQRSLKAQQEQFREEVIANELVARSNKAEYERMYYFLEATKIVDEYLVAVEARRKQLEEMQAADSKEFAEQLEAQITEQNQAPSVAELN